MKFLYCISLEAQFADINQLGNDVQLHKGESKIYETFDTFLDLFFCSILVGSGCQNGAKLAPKWVPKTMPTSKVDCSKKY